MKRSADEAHNRNTVDSGRPKLPPRTAAPDPISAIVRYRVQWRRRAETGPAAIGPQSRRAAIRSCRGSRPRLPGGANIWVEGTSLFSSASGGLAGYNSSLGGPLTGVDIWWARWLYDGFDVDGILYLSRLTGAECVAVYDWTLASKLRPTRVADLTALADLPPATAVTERQASLVAWHSGCGKSEPRHRDYLNEHSTKSGGVRARLLEQREVKGCASPGIAGGP
jgi:hypothetical protein